MRRSKRIISLLCVVCLLISLLPMQVFASTTGLSPAGQALLDAAIAQGLVGGNGQTQQTTQTAPVTPEGSEGIILERESSANKSNFKKFKDVKGHWAESYLEWSVNLGLFQGVTSTKFKPDDGITRAQMLAVITRAFGATEQADISMYLDVKEDDWYYEYVALAQQMGILSGYGNTISPNEKVTRQETAEAIVKAAGYTYGSLENIKHFPDYLAIDTNSRVYLATAIENGLLFGFSDGTLGPQKKVTRAQFAVMMHRMADAYYTPDHIYQGRYIEGSLLVGMPDLTLNNMYVDGNLFITEGCGTSTITIKDTTVGGSIIVRGTGANTVKLVNSKAHNVIMCNPNNATSLYLDEMSSVKSVYVRDGEGGVSLHGNLGDVYVDTAKCPVKITDSVVDTLYVTAKLASITADKLTSFNAIRVESAAAGAAVDVAGAVGSLHIGASDTTIRLQGSLEKLTFGGGVSKVNLTLPPETALKNANLSADKLTLTLTGDIGDLTISGAYCKITLDADAIAGAIMVSGKGSSLTLQSGAKADKITLTGDRVALDLQSDTRVHSVVSYGDDVTIGSKGQVSGGVTINSGDNVKISLPECEVYNRGGTNVYVGTTEIERGETVTTNESGAIEKPKEEKPEEEILSLMLASKGTPSDFGGNGKYTYTMFGENLVFNPFTGKVSGKLHKIENFYWYREGSRNSAYATGYYLPLVISDLWTNMDYVLNIGGAVFDRSVTSWGDAYLGQVMVYVPVSQESIDDGSIKVEFTLSDGKTSTAILDVSDLELAVDAEDPDDPNEPGGEEENEDDGLPKPTISLALAVNGQPSDFGNAYSYSAFGYNLAFDRVTLRASGKLNKIEDFYWYSSTSENSQYATGYYLPLVLSSDIHTDDAILTIGNAQFTSEVISTGSAYNGKWMVYVPVSLDAINAGTITVKFDPDGVYNVFGAAKAVINVSNVELIGGMYSDSLWYETEAAPGLDGADTCDISIANNQSTVYPFQIKLSNEVLLETRGLNGAFGYWAGIMFKTPKSAESALITVTKPDGTSASSVYSVRDGKITWYGDAANTGADGSRVWTLSVTYRDIAQNNLDTVPTRYVLIDMSRVTLATSSTVIPESPAASNIHLSTLTEEEAESAFITLSRYGYNLRATAQSVAGVVFELDDSATTYQIPVKVSATIAEDTKILIGDTVIGTLRYTDPGDGSPVEASVAVRLLADAYGNGVGDVELVAASADDESVLNSVTVHIDCSNLIGASGGIFVSGVSGETVIDGVTVSATNAGDLELQQGLANYVTATGTLKKMENYISDGVDAWVLPLSVYVSTASEDWAVRNELDGSMWSSYDYPSGVFDTLVVVARSDRSCSKTVYLELVVPGEEDFETESSLMISFDGTLEGYEDPEPVKPPVARYISVIAETDTEALQKNLLIDSENIYIAGNDAVIATLLPHEIPNMTGPSTYNYKLPLTVQFTALEALRINGSSLSKEVELTGKILLEHVVFNITAADIEAGYITVKFTPGAESNYSEVSYDIDISGVRFYTE